jgi:type IV fimbrial biogenesis protein FimT
MFYNKKRGFTVLETVTSIAVFSIMLMFSIPYFHKHMANIEAKTVQNTLISSLQIAKNQASIYHTNVVVCSSENGQSCQRSNWENGLIIFFDRNNNRQLDMNEKLIKTEATNLKYGSLSWKGTLNSASITFNGLYGFPIGYNGSFYYCSYQDIPHKRLVLSKMGHIRVEHPEKC